MPAGSLRFRSLESEILDNPVQPEDVRARCYRDLARTHRWLGNFAAVLRRIRRDPLPVRSVLDVGCAHGALLQHLRRELGVDVVGVDLAPPAQPFSPVPILHADATRDPLPPADVAVSLMLAHHLPPAAVGSLIRNVGRSCRRFLLIDLVRHPAPRALFRTFVAPFVNPINVDDGLRSFARAFTPLELDGIVRDALAGSGSIFRHDVAPLWIRQVVDIQYRR